LAYCFLSFFGGVGIQPGELEETREGEDTD
jgi:hypothetical protein